MSKMTGRFELDLETNEFVLIPDIKKMSGLAAFVFNNTLKDEVEVKGSCLPDEVVLWFDDDGAGKASLSVISCSPPKD